MLKLVFSTRIYIFFFIHYDDNYKYPNINLLGISSGVVILLAMKLAAREVEVRVPCRHLIFFLFLSCLMAKRKGVEVLHVSTRFPALTLFFLFFFWQGNKTRFP